ncbi:MAG: cupin domain-containing protein [Clostridia bacterium]
MMQSPLDIAARLRELRDACGYSIEQLASELSIDAAVYAGYEVDGRDIPISIIFEIANLFHVDFNEILSGSSSKLDTYHVVRAGDGAPCDRMPGYHFTDLASRYAHKIMQPLMVTLDADEPPAQLVSHKGQEFNYVLEGQVIVFFGDREIALNVGDSIYFNPKLPHGQRCGDAPCARFLTVIAE